MENTDKYLEFDSISDLKTENWISESPFQSFDFFKGLETSGCLGADPGWVPKYYTNNEQDLFMYCFEKTNSYGEYIFDWNWADAYHRTGVHYYPKMTAMVPFTPVTVNHFIGDIEDLDKVENLLAFYHKNFLQSETTSSHFLFLKESEISLFQNLNYLIRESFQYHFKNKNYKSFSDFLQNLKSRKAKQIRKERDTLTALSFQKYSGQDLTAEHAENMFEFYLETIKAKGAIAYLNLEFFCHLFKNLKENIVYVEATLEGQRVAGAFFLFDKKRLYGRYWGCSRPIKNLHFELCYYQGIDILIEKGLEVFEAGAQGEHKIARGFTPVRTFSAHFMKGDEFQNAISKFIEQEKEYIGRTISELEKYLPFK